MFSFESIGSFKNTERFLGKMSKFDFIARLKSVADKGVKALAAATPTDSGLTAGSWGYEITHSKNSFSIVWTNTNVTSGFPVAVMLQYGHGTGTGGYVQGRDYINPAMSPVFEDILNELWTEVISA